MTEEKTVYTDEEKKISKESERKRPKMVKFAKEKKRKEQKRATFPLFLHNTHTHTQREQFREKRCARTLLKTTTGTTTNI